MHISYYVCRPRQSRCINVEMPKTHYSIEWRRRRRRMAVHVYENKIITYVLLYIIVRIGPKPKSRKPVDGKSVIIFQE